MSEFSDRPLVAGALRGVRSFAVDPRGRLTGVNQQVVWEPGENIAQCYLESRVVLKAIGVDVREDDHPTATLDCKCGFYAFFDGSNDYSGYDTITGIIEGYGRVVVGSRGFRCEKARIIALVTPDPRFSLYARWPESMWYRNYSKIPAFDELEEALERFPLIPPPGWEPLSLEEQYERMALHWMRTATVSISLPEIQQAMDRLRVEMKKASERQRQLQNAAEAARQQFRLLGYTSPDGMFVPEGSPPPSPEDVAQPQDHRPKGSGKQAQPFWAEPPSALPRWDGKV